MATDNVVDVLAVSGDSRDIALGCLASELLNDVTRIVLCLLRGIWV